jgi:hypothetical protein
MERKEESSVYHQSCECQSINQFFTFSKKISPLIPAVITTLITALNNLRFFIRPSGSVTVLWEVSKVEFIEFKMVGKSSLQLNAKSILAIFKVAANAVWDNCSSRKRMFRRDDADEQENHLLDYRDDARDGGW